MGTENWLDSQAQKVVIKAMKPSWRSVSSSVHQGSIPGPILFSIFINYLGHNGPLTRCADDTKQEGVTDISDRCARKTSRGWKNGLTDISPSSTRASAKTCIWGRTAPGITPIKHNLWVSTTQIRHNLSEQLESSFAKNLLDTKIIISQQSAPAAKLTGYPGLHWQECCQETKGGDPASFISSGEASPAVLWPGLGSQYTRCMNTLQSPEKGQEDDYRADERRERDLGWFSLEKVWGEFINVHKYPKGLQRGRSQDQRQRAQSEKSGNTFPLWGWLSTGRSCPDRL